MNNGIYEVYTDKNIVEAKEEFEEKYGYTPNDVQLHGNVVLAGPVNINLAYFHSVEQIYKDDEEDE